MDWRGCLYFLGDQTILRLQYLSCSGEPALQKSLPQDSYFPDSLGSYLKNSGFQTGLHGNGFWTASFQVRRLRRRIKIITAYSTPPVDNEIKIP